ncbi:hypothetical protein EFK50_19895 [Nocardioides marmoriginsengisoli]|uniref:Uncharacterized protein n=1 Tax=Nocardioides marmoriginsengisoli TaxID=661483 RepID=A0A3N0CBF8_9ACTN|nr:hypothetical protein [Nocardioides marmoriginsengisoli]RNL60581.1 hypothetical protein EFK50_19895 [Nocardioides marmoriginsengisoli]
MTEYLESPGERPGRTFTITFDLSRLPTAATAAGVALVSAAVVVSAMYTRNTGDLDTSNFVMGALSALGLLGFAVVAHLVVPDAERRAGLVSWPGAAGAAGLGVMLSVLISNDDVSIYAGAGLALVLSVAGYLLTRAAPFVLSSLAALVVLYAKLFDDVIDEGDEGSQFIVIGAAVMIFVMVATAAGWLLPATRELTGIVVGIAGLATMAGVLMSLGTIRAMTVAFSEFRVSGFDDETDFAEMDDLPGGHFFSGVGEDPYQNDVYIVLLFCLALALFWFGCALSTGHVGFRLLVAGSAVLIIPIATIALMANRPTWWEVGACALGGLVLIGAAARARRPETPAEVPVAP